MYVLAFIFLCFTVEYSYSQSSDRNFTSLNASSFIDDLIYQWSTSVFYDHSLDLIPLNDSTHIFSLSSQTDAAEVQLILNKGFVAYLSDVARIGAVKYNISSDGRIIISSDIRFRKIEVRYNYHVSEVNNSTALEGRFDAAVWYTTFSITLVAEETDSGYDTQAHSSKMSNTGLNVQNTFTVDVSNYALDVLHQIQSNAQAASSGSLTLDDTQFNINVLSTSYKLNVTSRYVGNTTALQQSGEATVSINQTSEHPMTIIINFQYPNLTMNNSFAASEQQTGTVTTGKIITQIIGFEFQYQLLISLRNDGVYESDYVILKTLNQGSLDSTIVSEETIPAQVQQQILTIINNDYQSNTQQYIEDSIFEFAEFVYADIDVTNYFRYYLDDITIIDIKNYASDFLKDRQSLLLEQNIEVMSLDDIHTNIDTVANGSFELSITNRSLGDFTSMQQLGNALYSYNETAEYFNLNTYVTYVFPELLMKCSYSVTDSHTQNTTSGSITLNAKKFIFLHEIVYERINYNYFSGVLVYTPRSMGEDTEVVSGDDVPQEVREQIETVIKETYFYKDWDAIDTYISMYMAGRSRDEDLNINDYIHQ